MINFTKVKMASTQVVKTSVTDVANNIPSQDCSHHDDHFQSRCVTPWFKLFSYFRILLINSFDPDTHDCDTLQIQWLQNKNMVV